MKTLSSRNLRMVLCGICLGLFFTWTVFLRERSPAPVTPSFPQVDPPKAHIRRSEAVQVAQEAFRKANLPYEGLQVDARYVTVQEKDGSKHQEWWVFFVDPKVTQVGASGVHIDDRTGKTHVSLGA
ncbi:hypothetical protein [Armatimonas sp.]|uniref:hypothetical protein n=1 Tax=Armatimonas sp. TaxID=1872638 RepID=UPI00375335B7